MTPVVILGTDTDAGKTTLAALWLAAFGDESAYWKPLASGRSDAELLGELVPGAAIHPPVRAFAEPVAPLLAARRAGVTLPRATELAALTPHETRRWLLIETFGSPFSPLNEDELQCRFLQLLAGPMVLVTPSTVGAIGRTIQSLRALASEGLHADAVVLLGAEDPFAVEQITRQVPSVPVFSLSPPEVFDAAGVAAAAQRQLAKLNALRDLLTPPLAVTRPDLIAADARVIWHPYTSLKEPDSPLVVTRAQDEFLDLADGRRVIDGISSWWTILHGHRQPLLLRALAEAAGRLDHVHFAGVTHQPAIELAELLLASLPWSGGRVFYSDNGSTAVEVALKMAYQFWRHQGEPRRTLFVGFEGGYHGDTFGAMSVGRDPVFFGQFEPLLFRAEIIPLTPEALDQTLHQQAGTVAAVIVEPLVQGAGGMRMHSPQTLAELWNVARRHQVLFIADEVMTGGGRTGALWAHQAADITPDLICAAKTLAGGMLPLAATLAGPHIAAAWDTADRGKTFFHGHSFTAHPLACAVAAANWRLLQPDAIRQATRIEAIWRERLLPLQTLPQVADVRIRGSIGAVEIKAEGGYLADVGPRLRASVLRHNVLLRPLGNVLYALPPLGSSDESLHRIADAMQAAVADSAARGR